VIETNSQQDAKRWANRIARHSVEDPRSLVPNPDNWRRHPAEQVAVMGEVLDRIGWIGDVIVNETTGRMIDGHLRVEIAIERGEEGVPVGWVSLSEEEEKYALLSFDPVAAMAESDRRAFRAVADSVDVQDAAVRAMIAAELGDGSRSKRDPEVPFTEELMESHNYIVLYFDNEIDWLAAKDTFELKTVQTLDSRANRRRKGIGRVLRGAEWIRRLNRSL
jgi:hypothetical protein